jgi:hypothetical protein
MMRKNLRRLDFKADTKLALSIIVLWSFGRVINPLRHLASNTEQGVGPVLQACEILYVILHLAILVYAVMLLIASLRRHGFSMRGQAIGEFILYIYTIVGILVSLYFIAYEFGYLPDALRAILPYSVLNS